MPVLAFSDLTTVPDNSVVTFSAVVFVFVCVFFNSQPSTGISDVLKSYDTIIYFFHYIIIIIITSHNKSLSTVCLQ